MDQKTAQLWQRSALVGVCLFRCWWNDQVQPRRLFKGKARLFIEHYLDTSQFKMLHMNIEKH